MRQATAAELRKNTAGIIRAPRRMPVAEAVHKYMRVRIQRRLLQLKVNGQWYTVGA